MESHVRINARVDGHPIIAEVVPKGMIAAARSRDQIGAVLAMNIF
jgi:hypothetical protein